MPTPLTVRQIVGAYKADLETWAATVSAAVRFSRDPVQPYELLSALGANQRIVIVHWGGDDELGGNLLQPLSTHTLEVWIGHNRGLRADKDEALAEPIAAEKVLLDLVEECRQRVLSLVFPAEITRRRAKYAGTKPVATPEGIPLAAYRITFALDAAMVQIATRDAQT